MQQTAPAVCAHLAFLPQDRARAYTFGARVSYVAHIVSTVATAIITTAVPLAVHFSYLVLTKRSIVVLVAATLLFQSLVGASLEKRSEMLYQKAAFEMKVVQKMSEIEDDISDEEPKFDQDDFLKSVGINPLTHKTVVTPLIARYLVLAEKIESARATMDRFSNEAGTSSAEKAYKVMESRHRLAENLVGPALIEATELLEEIEHPEKNAEFDKKFKITKKPYSMRLFEENSRFNQYYILSDKQRGVIRYRSLFDPTYTPSSLRADLLDAIDDD